MVALTPMVPSVAGGLGWASRKYSSCCSWRPVRGDQTVGGRQGSARQADTFWARARVWGCVCVCVCVCVCTGILLIAGNVMFGRGLSETNAATADAEV